MRINQRGRIQYGTIRKQPTLSQRQVPVSQGPDRSALRQVDQPRHHGQAHKQAANGYIIFNAWDHIDSASIAPVYYANEKEPGITHAKGVDAPKVALGRKVLAGAHFQPEAVIFFA